MRVSAPLRLQLLPRELLLLVRVRVGVGVRDGVGGEVSELLLLLLQDRVDPLQVGDTHRTLLAPGGRVGR